MIATAQNDEIPSSIREVTKQKLEQYTGFVGDKSSCGLLAIPLYGTCS